MIHPYIARSTLEHTIAAPLVVRDGRIAYRDERPEDRDAQDILWNRQITAHRQGAPVFGKIHSPRQRHAALALLCQVCAGEPDENDEGILWLLPERDDRARVELGERVVLYPPICRACCAKALRMCPPLRAGHVLLRVCELAPAGVSGMLFNRECRPASTDKVLFRYGDPRLPMVIAGQQALALTQYSVVNGC